MHQSAVIIPLVSYPTISMLLHIMRHGCSIAKLSKPFSSYYFTTRLNVTTCLIPIQTSGVHQLCFLKVNLIYDSNLCMYMCVCLLLVSVHSQPHCINQTTLRFPEVLGKNPRGTQWCEHLCLQKHFGPLKKHRCHNKKRKHTQLNAHMTSQLRTVPYYTNTSYFYTAKSVMTIIFVSLVITNICLHYFIWLGC